ncbi:MAG: hypothetical protein DLM73_06320 [Chthoniobacterales bacterium]|nr:MAG: hypothetical protein DLM73_06320 [Chthoniobacterales bacterium]
MQNTSSRQESGELPNGWRIARVGDMLKVRNGYAFKSSDYRTEGVPLIRQSNLGDDLVDISEAKRVDPYFLKQLPDFIVRDGDLLIGMSGSLGKIARYQHAEPALQNQRTGLLMVKPEHEAKFAKLVLKYVEPQILAEGKGIAVQNVSAKEIEDCTFPLPSLEEQREIVAEIEKQFTRLEAGVAALRRVQANLKRYRAAVLKAACEGKLVPTEAKLAKAENRKFESGEELLARILTERRKNWTGRGKYKEPATPDTAGLQSLPEGWKWASVEQMLTEPLCNGVSVKGSDNPPGVRALRLSAMSSSGFDYWDARYLPLENSDVDDLWIQEGDFFMSRGNGSLHLVGRGTSAQKPPHPTIFPDTMIRLRLTGAVRKSGWLRILWPSWIIRSQIETRVKTTAGIYKIAQPQVEGMVVPLPPLAEETRVVAEVERRLSEVKKVESLVTVNLQRASRLRQSILQRAFRG